MHPNKIFRNQKKVSIISLIGFFCFVVFATANARGETSIQPDSVFVEGEVLILFHDEEIGLSKTNSVDPQRQSSTTVEVMKDRLRARHKNLEIVSREFFSGVEENRVGTHSADASLNEARILKIGLAREVGKTTDELIRELEKDPAVAAVQPNYRYFPEQAQQYSGNYENSESLWNIFNNENNAGVRANMAWEQGFTGEGVVIAVIDTGLELAHPDLNENLWNNPGETDCANGIDDEGNGFIDDCHGWDFGNNDNDPSPENPHGTHNSGTIGSAKNGTGTVGVAPKAKIMPIRIFTDEGTATTATIVSAIEYAWKNGAKIINMSFGTPRSTCPAVETEIINAAFSDGIFMTASSGNNGANAPQAPALCQYVFAVGATDEQKQLLEFSGSYLNVVEGVAPGNDIFSTTIGGDYGYLTGTSMAVPHVSGIAALMIDKKPDISPAEIAQTLCATAEDMEASGRDERTGCGFLSAEKAITALDITPTPTPTASPTPTPTPTSTPTPTPVPSPTPSDEFCHLFTGPETPIASKFFAPPYNLFSVAKELLLKVDCQAKKAIVGNGEENIWIYQSGYRTNASGNWEKAPITGTNTNTSVWSLGNAELALGGINEDGVPSIGYVAAYLCNRVGEEWKCGCRDAACQQPYWSLQAYRMD